MTDFIIFFISFLVLYLLELIYFRVADHFNIIDRPNERSSHSSIVLRGGGVVFLLSVWLWAALHGFAYPWFVLGVTLAAGVSFVDDVHSLPDSVRLVVQFIAMGLMILQLGLVARGLYSGEDGNLLVSAAVVVAALVVCVGAMNIFNFMDGINGITAAYSMSVLIPLIICNFRSGFFDLDLQITVFMALVVFALFNFRPRGKAKCFAGDVGSVGMAFILLFCIGMLVVSTGDVTWLVFLLVYGVDGCMTIGHRVLLHENLGKAHRKHAYQLMANELGMSHPLVSALYALLQLVVSLGFIFVCPATVGAHWIYLVCVLVVLCLAYVVFMKKYYHLHEEYLAGIEK